MKKYLLTQTIEQIDSGLPDSADQSITVAHYNEGIKAALVDLMRWQPEFAGGDDDQG